MANVSPNVLVVDDSVGVCMAVAMMLEDDGYTVEMAHTYQRGLRAVLDGNFRLAIIDVSLGRESGFDLATQIVWSNIPCKIILASGWVDLSGEFAKHPELKGVRLLHKPFGREALLDCVRQVIDAAA